MSKIDIDKFICSLIERQGVYRNNHAISELQIILGQQGLHYRNGEIVEIEEKTSSNHKPIGRFQTCPKCGGLLIYDDPEFDWYKCEQCGKITSAKELREQPPLTEEQKPISRIQSAQACADKDLGLSPYIEGTVPDIAEQNILMSSCTSIKENNKPQTIKFKTNDEKIYQDKSPLFQDSFDGLKERINPDKEVIEVRDDTGKKVLIPKKKIIERLNGIRLNESDALCSWSKQMVDEMQEDIAEGTPKVKEELKKYFANIFPYLYNVDVEKMTRDYSSGLLHSGYVWPSYFDRQIAYKRGLEDMLKLIKEGDEE